MELCDNCSAELDTQPYKCNNIVHWEKYANSLQQEISKLESSNYKLEEKLALSDADRDRYDVAEWLLNHEKVIDYNCRMCKKQYKIPIHLTHFTCVCGLKCRLRHVGGNDPYEAVIDAALSCLGNRRMAQLAYLAEIIGGNYCNHYDGNRIREMIRQELDRWQDTENGWVEKNERQ